MNQNKAKRKNQGAYPKKVHLFSEFNGKEIAIAEIAAQEIKNYRHPMQ